MSDKKPALPVPLNSGAVMPHIGFGVFDMDDPTTERATLDALELGFRHIDTAAVYFNERAVGRAVAASGIPRGELFVTTKLWNNSHTDPRPALETSLTELGLDYVDLYLIHWPDPAQGRYADAWEGLAALADAGLARSIGVSNFTIDQIDEVTARTGITPAVNQIELHPLHPQEDARNEHTARGIVTQAWSPFARGKAFGTPVLATIAARHGRSESQVILRWALQLGVVPLPKSATRERIAENLDVWDFELETTELDQISALESDERVDSTLYDRFQ
jgi:2,5-diketo-D-gluconate reductase A